MKILWKVLAIALIIGVICFVALENREPRSQEPERAPLPLLKAADSAQFMVAYAVGIGDVKRKRTIDGRLYRNFVQLLRMGRLDEDLLSIYATECKTGIRMAFYRDTTLVDEFYLSDRIGRTDGAPGVWTPKNLAKINKFLKDAGMQFMACEPLKTEPDYSQEASALREQSAVLTMPKLKRHKVNSNEAVTNNVNDAESNSLAPAENMNAPAGLDTLTTQVLKNLESIIMPMDTALGTPLQAIADSSSRMVVTLKDCPMDEFVLNVEQANAFRQLLKDSSFESYAGFCNCVSRGTISLYRDSTKILDLWMVGSGFFEKHQVQGDFEQGGFWKSLAPEEMDRFFEKIKIQSTACRTN